MLKKYERDPSVNNFIEAVMCDNSNVSIEQSEIHRLWQDHIDWCWSRGLSCGIIGHWGAGKTTQTLGRVLYELGRNCNALIKYICNIDENAIKRLVVIKRYIESRGGNLHRIFPSLVPGKSAELDSSKTDRWSRHMLVVNRDINVPDASLEAWGIDSAGIGGRATHLFFDDIVDHRNAIQEPARREKVKAAFKNVWLSRAEPGCKILYIATPWHEDDCTAELLKNSEWCVLISKVSEDMEYLDTSLLNGDETHPVMKFNLPLSVWHRVWGSR